jgi:hypothetical protein
VTTPRRDTLLAALVRERRLTQDEAVALLRERARLMGIAGGRFNLTVRQFQRWVAGQVKLPHPTQCRVLEAEYGRPVEELMAPPPGCTPGRRGLLRLRLMAATRN